MIKVICSYLFGWNLFFIQLQTFMRHDGICHAKFNQAAFKKKKVKKLEIQVWVIFNFFDDSLNPAPSTLLGFLSPVSKIRCWKEKKTVCVCLSCTSWHKFIFSRNLLNDSGAEQQASGCVYDMARWAAEGEKSHGAPSLSDVLSTVFVLSLCRHPAPVRTKPAKTKEQNIPCVLTELTVTQC